MAETPNDIFQAVHEAYLKKEEWLKETYNRSLSFSDAMFDRWERAERLGFGKGTSIYNSALVYGEVTVGEGTWIGPFCLIDGSGGGVRIGSTCSISAGVQIYTHDSVLWAISGGTQPMRRAPVLIGDSVYVGSQTIIAPGVEIGSMAVIAANSFINGDVPARTIFGGTPMRQLGVVEGEGPDVRLVYDSKGD